MTRFTLACLILLLACGCVTTESEQSGAAAAKRSLATGQVGWTTDFMRRRLLVADEVRVIGPQGLRTHLATRFDPAQVSRKEKTIAEGYLQTFIATGTGDSQIACYLDKFEIHAIRKLTVLERPGPFDVTVEGVGDVYYVDIDGHDEQRLPNVRIEGKIQR